MLCYAWSDTRSLPTFCIQPKDVLPFSFVDHTVFIYYNWQALWKFSLLKFVSTIFSSIVITEAVSLSVRFCLSHKLQILYFFRNISLCICFSRYSSFRFSSTPFFNLVFIVSILVSSLFQSFPHSVRCNLPQNLSRTHCMH